MSRRGSSFAMKAFLLSGAAAGGLLVVASLAWMMLAKPSDVWSPEQASEFNAARGALHAAISGTNRGGAGSSQSVEEAVAAAQSRFDRINGELESARTARSSWGWRGVLAGAVTTAIFGVGFRFVENDAG